MATIDTTLEGVSFLNPPQKGQENLSFLRAFERAQEQKSPLYQAQVQQVVAHAQGLAFQMQNEQLNLEINQHKMKDMLEGKEAKKKLYEIMATMDPSDPATLAAMYRANAQNPTKEGDAAVAEGEARFDKANTLKMEAKRLETMKEVAGIRSGATVQAAEIRAQTKDEDVGVTPQVQVIEGKKFLVNPKTGAVHEISKDISKQQFMAQHIGQWMRDNFGMTKEEVAKDMSDFYDKNIAPSKYQPAVKQGVDMFGLTPEQKIPKSETKAPASTKTVKVKKPDGTVGFLPENRLDEAIKAGWSKVE